MLNYRRSRTETNDFRSLDPKIPGFGILRRREEGKKRKR
jgi:hypothetical protein